MFTISDILRDVDAGIMANNMIETCFTYRIVYFVNENGKGTKFFVDTSYENFRKTLENIIRSHLSVTNSVVVAQTTVLKDRKPICLQSRAYSFSLDGYFEQINGEYKDSSRNGNAMNGSPYMEGRWKNRAGMNGR